MIKNNKRNAKNARCWHKVRKNITIIRHVSFIQLDTQMKELFRSDGGRLNEILLQF